MAEVDALVGALKLVTPDRTTGEPRRFACQCGLHTFDPAEAMMHAFLGAGAPQIHGVYIERFGRGRWVFDRKPLLEMLVERMRQPGETIPDLGRRITAELNARMDELDQLDKAGAE